MSASNSPRNSASTTNSFAWMGCFALITAGVVYVIASRQPPSDTEPTDPGLESPSSVTEMLPHSVPTEQHQLPNTVQAHSRSQAIQSDVAPNANDWPTEFFHERAAHLLKTWVAGWTDSEVPTAEFAKTLAFDRLRPSQLETSFTTPTTTVKRYTTPSPSDEPPIPLTESISELRGTIHKGYRIAVKITGVTHTARGFETRVLVEGGGLTPAGGRQWNATWICQWTQDDDHAILHELKVTKYEEVETNTSSWLVDSTASVLANTHGYANQLLYGMDYWVNKIEHRLNPNRLGHHGLAIGDANSDGLEDIYVCQPGGLPNLLYLHQPDGTAIESAMDSGVAFYDDTTASLFADLDNDGDQDLAVLTVSGGFVFSNESNGKFRLAATMPDCQNTFSLTAADYDSDGLLDLYIGRYWPEASGRGAIPLPVPYYDAVNGGRNVLLRNTGNWNFQDVTEASGLDIDNTRYTMAASWEDFDNDGDQDLYVANDFGRNCLYRNDDGLFKNVAAELGVEDTAAGMSVSWADYDHDGLQDLYVGNMFSSAGNRIAYQRQYEQQFTPEAQTKLKRLARGNSLFRNGPNGTFTDVSLSSGTTMGRWAWGSLFTDLNNDGWDDLLIANGHVTTEDTGDL